MRQQRQGVESQCMRDAGEQDQEGSKEERSFVSIAALPCCQVEKGRTEKDLKA
jgi:hypothetical protein